MTNPNDPAIHCPNCKPENIGLTKREYFAIEILKAIIGGRYGSGEVQLINVDGVKVIHEALTIVDVFIAELNKGTK